MSIQSKGNPSASGQQPPVLQYSSASIVSGHGGSAAKVGIGTAPLTPTTPSISPIGHVTEMCKVEKPRPVVPKPQPSVDCEGFQLVQPRQASPQAPDFPVITSKMAPPIPAPAAGLADLLSVKNGFEVLAGIEKDPKENVLDEPFEQALGADPIPSNV
ncbi:unnamed protein product [Amaranthus hypochondriacus]